MGIADLKDAFNAVALPAFTCTRALMTMEQANGAEWQRLHFSGISAAGVPFDVTSDRVRSNDDLATEARATAQRLLDNPPA